MVPLSLQDTDRSLGPKSNRQHHAFQYSLVSRRNWECNRWQSLPLQSLWDETKMISMHLIWRIIDQEKIKYMPPLYQELA